MRVLAVLKLHGDVCVAIAVDPPRALLELVLRTQPRRLCARDAHRGASAPWAMAAPSSVAARGRRLHLRPTQATRPASPRAPPPR